VQCEMRSAYPSQIALYFQMANDKKHPLQKDKDKPRKPKPFVFSLSLSCETALPRWSVKWK